MRGSLRLTTSIFLLLVGAGAVGAQQNAPGGGARPAAPPPMVLSSTGFTDGSTFPAKFTCDSKGAPAVSPELQWTNVPPGTVSFVLITHDMEPRPNKGLDDSLHWILWNIPGTTTQLPEGASINSVDLPDGSHQSSDTNRGKPGFRGPCPAAGVPAHHYVFDLYALDTKLSVPEKATRAEITNAMDGHILGHALTMGLYR